MAIGEQATTAKSASSLLMQRSLTRDEELHIQTLRGDFSAGHPLGADGLGQPLGHFGNWCDRCLIAFTEWLDELAY